MRSGRKIFLVAFLIILGMIVPAAYLGWKLLYSTLLERESPKIVFKDVPPGIGVGEGVLRFHIEDSFSGLDEVIVRQEQDQEIKDLLKRRYRDEKKFSDDIEIRIPGRDGGLGEGAVKLIVTVFDKAFFSNKAVETLDLKVDFRAPQIEVVTTQHNAVLGGAELVFFRVHDNVAGYPFTAVKAGGMLFPGFRARELDPAFAPYPDLYFAFFAVPLGFREEQDELRVFVRDEVGNISVASFYYKIANFARGHRTTKLESVFVEPKVSDLFDHYQELNYQLTATPKEAVGPTGSVEELISRFRSLNENYRTLVNRSLERVFASPKEERFWRGKFIWMPGRTTSDYAEETSFLIDGVDAGRIVNEGVNLAASPGAGVPAANDGVIIFADQLGPYGLTLIIDHGFGLTTMYSGLSVIAPNVGVTDASQRNESATNLREGDRVSKGQIIGRTGQSGLNFRDEVHFEARLNGVPIRPWEWWDATWIKGHIENKIADVKRQLGIAVLEPIE